MRMASEGKSNLDDIFHNCLIANNEKKNRVHQMMAYVQGKRERILVRCVENEREGERDFKSTIVHK